MLICFTEPWLKEKNVPIPPAAIFFLCLLWADSICYTIIKVATDKDFHEKLTADSDFGLILCAAALGIFGTFIPDLFWQWMMITVFGLFTAWGSVYLIGDARYALRQKRRAEADLAKYEAELAEIKKPAEPAPPEIKKSAGRHLALVPPETTSPPESDAPPTENKRSAGTPALRLVKTENDRGE